MWRWRRKSSFLRPFSTAVRRQLQDEGHWSFSPEWWGTHSQGSTVLRSSSATGNGLVSVLSYPSSSPVSISHFHLTMRLIIIIISSSSSSSVPKYKTTFPPNLIRLRKFVKLIIYTSYYQFIQTL